ncbi:unnamed protein product [Phytophthora fragariaefolia]|uniref:Unnamed protein product n=1 Tax=Phytophthora fragariaefolia TaxID=1490495 RepID=A0A9W7DC80_9STRA|nr:unnamed protein product [Phytophthora fragariaefolia]
MEYQSCTTAPRWSAFVLLERVPGDGGSWQAAGGWRVAVEQRELAEDSRGGAGAAHGQVAERDGAHDRDAGGLGVAVFGGAGVARGSEHPGLSVSVVVGSDVAAGGAEEHGGRAGAAVTRPGERAGRDAGQRCGVVGERAGGNVVGVSNMSAVTLASNTSDDDGSAAGVLQVLPVTTFLGVFRDKQNEAQKVEVARRLVISLWHPDLSPMMR